jgi:ABC-type phosphate/phosphonate transport system substrate-binding protein
MYDWPEVRPHTDRLWQALRAALRANGFPGAPDELERNIPVHDQWRLPDLLLSQTCGYPLTHGFDDDLTVLAAPVYAVDGCSGADYSSFIVVHKDSRFTAPADLRAARAAYNTDDSLSGHLALRSVFAPHADAGRFFGEVIRSGGHAVSMEMVADGRADVAAIDCVSYALCLRHRPKVARRLRRIATSPSAPALPYVTSKRRTPAEVSRLKRVLADVFSDTRLSETRTSLFIEGLEFVTRQTYDRVFAQEAEADRHGYTGLN